LTEELTAATFFTPQHIQIILRQHIYISSILDYVIIYDINYHRLSYKIDEMYDVSLLLKRTANAMIQLH